ncbi:putative DUF636 domain protein [Diplogelasinospora grovesii]|uniref:DUF636 domain protein n=1 Tax=Diplogelasinospora grovesii TaxID=303347 RepID=A0AAN6NEE5_9PEZI|nr:putative DUF636 domain protein [Diplogelasinospora grovesii]
MGLLPASCHCGTVSFLISRPDPSISTLPHSNFPDLMLPYCRTSSSVISNHADEKWWIRGGTGGAKSRYLAGTCACRSCRLGSGFEIQTWAFVPRANILFGIPSTAGGGRTELKPLDFATLPRGVLQSYESSVGVIREFCGRCGATIFWHDKWRPDLIDVSVGLLRAPEGARAETWLEWWTDRVSFAEEAGNERAGSVMNWATTLIAYLEDGLKKRQEPCEDEDSLWAQTQRSC